MGNKKSTENQNNNNHSNLVIENNDDNKKKRYSVQSDGLKLNTNIENTGRRETISVINNIQRMVSSPRSEAWMFPKLIGNVVDQDGQKEIWIESDMDSQHQMFLLDYSFPQQFSLIESEIKEITFENCNLVFILTEDGKIYTWGSDHSLLGRNGKERLDQISFSKKVLRISSGDNFSAFISEDGSLHTFGKNTGKKKISISFFFFFFFL